MMRSFINKFLAFGVVSMGSLLACPGKDCNHDQANVTTSQVGEMEEPHNVMVLLIAKPGKESALKEALHKVARLSREESSCLSYYLYQDPDHPTQFALYERWASKELHQEQFTKPYILEFAEKAEALLAEPYRGFFGKKLS